MTEEEHSSFMEHQKMKLWAFLWLIAALLTMVGFALLESTAEQHWAWRGLYIPAWMLFAASILALYMAGSWTWRYIRQPWR